VQFDKEASQACDIASQRTRRFARLAQIAFDYAQARLSRRKERLLQDDNQTAPPPESGYWCSLTRKRGKRAILRRKGRDASHGSPRSPSTTVRPGFRGAKSSRMTIKLHHHQNLDHLAELRGQHATPITGLPTIRSGCKIELTRCLRMLFIIGSINRDFHTREAQFTAMDVRGYGESDQEQ
jgi:hypothetical protein